MEHKNILLRKEGDVIAARQAGRALARALDFGLADQTRLATAISELTRNVIQYAGEGYCEVADLSNNSVRRIQVVVEDHGPGIPDVDRAMQRGFSTGSGLGAGLPGAKRLVHEFEIKSEPGRTWVKIAMTRRRR